MSTHPYIKLFGECVCVCVYMPEYIMEVRGLEGGSKLLMHTTYVLIDSAHHVNAMPSELLLESVQDTTYN